MANERLDNLLMDTDNKNVLAHSNENQKQGQKRARDAEKKKSCEEVLPNNFEDLRISKDFSKRPSWYYKRELFTAAFKRDDYVSFVKKGRAKIQLTVLDEAREWKWLYHCNGPWQAEALQNSLQEEGCRAIVVKRKKGGADAEVFSYKVISGPTRDDEHPVVELAQPTASAIAVN
jgi:hypothetical protein